MENFREKLVEELASRGIKEAVLEMADYYIYNQKVEELDKEKSEKTTQYLIKLAENNDKDAMVSLGGMYYGGRGVHQSYKEAVKWYEKAAEKLDEYGLCYLGYCYYYGRDIDIDYEKAYLCFSHSAFLENSNAMFKLGDMYFNGFHVEENKEAAFFWYNKSYTNAVSKYEKSSIAYRLGRCYLYGYGVKQNLLKALKKLQIAEKGFFALIIDYDDEHAEIVIKDVRKELDKVRNILYNMYKIE